MQELEALNKFHFCPDCAKGLSKITGIGMSATELQNGGARELIMKVQSAEMILKQTGTQLDQKQMEGKMMSILKRIRSEEFVEKLENEKSGLVEEISKMKIEFEKSKNKEQKNIRNEIKGEYLEKYKDYERYKSESKNNKLDVEKREKELDELKEELKKYKNRVELISSLKGDKQEQMISDAIKRSFPLDDILIEKKGRNEIDIIDVVKDGKKEIGKILVESKNTKSWSNGWLKKAKEHMNRENAEYCIIATKTMPNEKRISPIGIEKEGILITDPENVHWATAYFRLAMLKTFNEIQKLENERQKLMKQEKVKEKVMRLLNTKDFERVYEACKDISDQSQKIRNHISKVKTTIFASTETIDNIVESVVKSNEKMDVAFKNLTN